MTKADLLFSLARLETFIQVFGVLVAIGIVGEVGVGLRHRILNRQLQTILDAEAQQQQSAIATLNKEAAHSREQAAKFEAEVAGAKERAAKAEQEAAKAKQQAAEASAKAESFRLDIARADERAANANRTAEQERLARLQLEARLADRTLTPEQQKAIRSQLAAVSGILIDVVIFGDATEIQIISGLVLNSIPQPEWTVHRGQAGAGFSTVRGILVGTRAGSDANVIRASKLLVSALQSAGLAAGSWPFDQLEIPGVLLNSFVTRDAPIRMFIGSK